MNWDRVEGNWKQVTGKAKEQWGKLAISASRAVRRLSPASSLAL
jgi:hypothetical protein